MMIIKDRSIKVYGQSGYKYQETPTIVLKGKWLAECGFYVGEYVSIRCEEGKLLITLDKERKNLESAKAIFLDKEIETLRKRFQKEFEEQGSQFLVAEGDSL